jgi:hypothetical protein
MPHAVFLTCPPAVNSTRNTNKSSMENTQNRNMCTLFDCRPENLVLVIAVPYIVSIGGGIGAYRTDTGPGPWPKIPMPEFPGILGQEFQNSRILGQEFWNSGILESSRIPGPEFWHRNFGIFQNSKIPIPEFPGILGQEFWKIPKFQNSWVGSQEFVDEGSRRVGAGPQTRWKMQCPNTKVRETQIILSSCWNH